MPADDNRLILPDPPPALKTHSDELKQRIAAKIHRDGPIPFSTYMEMALYEPGLGYYSAGLPKLGAGGDFVTAPELGNLFARCLVRQAEQIGAELNDWDVLEIGAGSGKMAADFLTACRESGSKPTRYRILERSAHLRTAQQEALRAAVPDWIDRIEWLDAPPDQQWQGVILANEVIDALPVERFRVSDTGVEQVGVALQDGELTWDWWPAPQALQAHLDGVLERLEYPLPKRYTSEVCPMLSPWLNSVTGALTRGAALFIDYGYPRQAYYLPQRADGTLVCHYQHRAHDDPFWWPGLQDLTAFVDFTALAEAADQHRLDVSGYASQAMFLLGCGLESSINNLAELPPQERQSLSHEARELTLPDAMGEKFQCMALTRNLDLDLRGFEWSDLRSRL